MVTSSWLIYLDCMIMHGLANFKPHGSRTLKLKAAISFLSNLILFLYVLIRTQHATTLVSELQFSQTYAFYGNVIQCHIRVDVATIPFHHVTYLRTAA
jgi:hypothetical protein